MKSVKGRKERKDEELNREVIRPFGQSEEKSEVPECEDRYSLGEFFFTQAIFLNVVISIQYSEIIRNLSDNFFQREMIST